MTIRDQLREKIAQRFALIRTGAQVTIRNSGTLHTFATDIGSRVLTWRMTDVHPNEWPCIGFADTDAEGQIEQAELGMQEHRMRIDATALVTVEEQATVEQTTRLLAETAGAALADVLAAIGIDPEWDNLSDAWTELESTEIELDAHGRALAAAHVTFAIHYYTPLWVA